MFLHKTPILVQKLFPSLTWRVSTQAKELYLTFDDGPIPGLTPWVLEVLARYEAKATFFCVGHNVEKHPNIFRQILAEGHSVGNHTFHHLNGWQTEAITYLKDSLKADEAMAEYVQTSLFRPPYGWLTLKQRQQHRHKKIVMWDVLSGDFSPKLKPEAVLSKSIAATRPGSIIVFHDNLKAEDNLKYALPAYLEHFTNLGYTFKTL